MALEQSQIKESESAGGILGISQDRESCEQWALTRHLKSFVSTSFKEMSCVSEDTDYHKELRPERIKKKDEEDVFDYYHYRENGQPLGVSF